MPDIGAKLSAAEEGAREGGEGDTLNRVLIVFSSNLPLNRVLAYGFVSFR